MEDKIIKVETGLTPDLEQIAMSVHETAKGIEALVLQNDKDNPIPALEGILVKTAENSDLLKSLIEEVKKKEAEDNTLEIEIDRSELKGDKGDKGDIGEKGDKGDTGPEGKQGIQGVQGKEGKKGLDGLDGKDGKNGTDGRDGKDAKNVTSKEIHTIIKNFSSTEKISFYDLKDSSEVFQQVKLLAKMAGGSSYIHEIADVNLTNLQDGDALKYNRATNKWVNGTVSSGGGIWGTITGTLSDQTDLQTALNAKLTANAPITGATKTKITYDINGLVTAGADATTTDIAEGTNLYYTVARFNTAFASKSTTDLSEGTNLYYTIARFNTAFASKTTSDLTEGSNLYFTGLRAINARLLGYASTTGTISSGDTILTAIQKLNGNMAALVTGVSSVNSLTGAVPLTGTPNRLTINASNVFDISATFETLLGKVANPLSQFAATTSAQLAGVISDETGSGPLVFGTGPTISLASASTAVTQSANDNSTKIATTAYVDSAFASTDAKPDVQYCSTTALPANTYANGSSGVGATLTGNSNGPLIIDGVTILVGQVGQRVLVAGETTQANNGWYKITQQGVVAISPYILTRTTESDQGSEIGSGYITSVIATNGFTVGSSNNGKVFISVAAANPFVVGTTNLTFSAIGTTSSLSVGSTVISGGTTARVLYDNAGVLGEYVLGGTGSVAALQIANTFAGINTFANNYNSFGPLAAYLPVSKGVDFVYSDNTTSGAQIGVENQSGGTSAYNGIYLNNNLAVDGLVDHFCFWGQNSSTYTDTTFGSLFAVANLMYFQNTDAPIAYITSSASAGGHIFYDGGTATTNEILRVTKTAMTYSTAPLTVENSQSGTTYTLVLTDGYSKAVTSTSSSATTFTVPPNSSVAFPIGTKIDIIQLGTGKLTIAAGAGVTINSQNSNKSMATQYVGATLWKQGTNTWLLLGNLIP